MKQRILGKTGREVSEIGLGTWQLGTKWGEPFNEEEAMKILETADQAGITFKDENRAQFPDNGICAVSQ